MEHIGQKIKDLRKKADLTQDRLADYLGVSSQAVSKWEVGQASPDLALIAPLCRVLGCSADELLGLNEQDEESEALIEELRAYKVGNITREMAECLPALEKQAAAYPTNLRLLYQVAEAKYRVWHPLRDGEDAVPEDIEKRCHAVIDRTTDLSLRDRALYLLAEMLIDTGRREEAKQYAEAYSSEGTRDMLILRCLEGDEWLNRQEWFVYGNLNQLLNMLMQRTDHLPSVEMIENIIKTIFPDGNYLGYYPRLIMGSLLQARLLVRQGDCELAMEKLHDFVAYARSFEKLNDRSGHLSYTSPVLDHWGENAEALIRANGGPFHAGDYVRKHLNLPDLAPLRDRDDFKALMAELETMTEKEKEAAS
ncbi:MAG: helix-turn-helix domain-containing protein [Clostridiales bacterium]|nr:helix-turn-helix domain-containing protein [Clostridiales bacterium]